MTFKISNKLRILNFEQKLLFLATLAIPLFILSGILALGLKEIYKTIYDFVYPPGNAIDFSVCGFGLQPWFLIGYVIICGIILSLSSICVLNKRFFTSTIILIFTISIIALRAIYVYKWIWENFNSPTNDIFFSFLVEDLIFIVPVALLTIWQISILWRISAKNSQLKIGLK